MHFGMELHRIKVARDIRRHRKRRVGRGAINRKARRNPRDMVAVAHPDLFFAIGKPAVQDRQAVCGRGQEGAAKFCGAMAAFDQPAQLLHHGLLTIADPQHRHAQRPKRLGRTRRTRAGHRIWPPRKDHCLGRKAFQEAVIDLIIGMNFAINIQLAQATRDKLRNLRTKVDDKEAIMLCHGLA